MDQPVRDGGVTISVAVHSDLDEMAALLAEVFSTREPPAVAAGFAASKIAALATVFGAKSVRENLSVVARSSDGAMVGAVLAHDFANPPPDEIEPLVPVFAPLLAFLDQLEDTYAKTHDIAAGGFIHVFMIAVEGNWLGQGIADQLVQACMSNGASLGYRMAFTEATSKASRHLFQKTGFQQRHFARYADFEFDGGRPFATISDHHGCALMDKTLG